MSAKAPAGNANRKSGIAVTVCMNPTSVAEVVSDGVNGLLVPPGSPEAFGQALQRLLQSPELRTRLSDGARESVLELNADLIYGRIEQLLEAAVRP